MKQIDWRCLAEKMGTITWNDSGHSESGGTVLAKQALVEIIGDKIFCAAVDFYVSHEPGYELARSVLLLLNPPAAMDRCMELFRNADDAQQATDAIELLRVVADKRALNWVPEIMASDNSGVRVWGVSLLDQLWMAGEIEPDDGRPFVRAALCDVAQNVRDQAQQVLEMWDESERLELEKMRATQV